MTAPVGSTPGPQPQPPAAAPQPGAVDKNMFLQLLVAQLRNQDPLNPTDGTAFVGQLAQFQQLETSLNMGQDLATIRQDLDALVQSAGSGSSQS